MLKHIDAGMLRVSYEEEGGSSSRTPVFLLHGFPYDIHAYTEVTPILVAAGCRVVLPYLRGFGTTRFLRPDTLRSGQQAALGHDLLMLMDSLRIPSAVLAGYDWGGRAACIVAALWPDRANGLVSGGGYNIQNIPGASLPLSPETEHRLWYQYYFHSERGRTGLASNRVEFCKLLWRLWSPGWTFDVDTYMRSAVSFDNPDFVDVVIHSYRHRFGLVAGDPSLQDIEDRLAVQPRIHVPTIVMDGDNNGVMPPEGSTAHARYFAGRYQRRVMPGAGHNLPQEAPREFAAAVLDLV